MRIGRNSRIAGYLRANRGRVSVAELSQPLNLELAKFSGSELGPVANFASLNFDID
jgi:hypothetical protein